MKTFIRNAMMQNNIKVITTHVVTTAQQELAIAEKGNDSYVTKI